jgi:hypothetical protein
MKKGFRYCWRSLGEGARAGIGKAERGEGDGMGEA